MIRAFNAFIEKPRNGEVYNLGGGRGNAASLLECIAMMEAITGKKFNSTYSETNRVGDHICYISDLRKMREHFPGWDISVSLPEIVEQIVRGEMERSGK